MSRRPCRLGGKLEPTPYSAVYNWSCGTGHFDERGLLGTFFCQLCRDKAPCLYTLLTWRTRSVERGRRLLSRIWRGVVVSWQPPLFLDFLCQPIRMHWV